MQKKWVRKQQEQEGTYRFSGAFFVTRGVQSKVRPEDIAAIYFEIQTLVQENNGLDYLQVFENGKGDRLFFIDQCNPEMMQDEAFKPEDNYCTLLFNYEY